MASEVGIKKNVENLHEVKTKAATWVPPYAPERDVLKLASLDSIYVNASAALANLVDKRTDENIVTNNRFNEFDKAPKLATRVVNALRASGTDQKTIDDAEGFLRKIRGARAKKPKKSADPITPTPEEHSVAQLSMDNIIQHLLGLFMLVKNDPLYKPTSTDLKSPALQAYLDGLIALNQAGDVVNAATAQAVIERNNAIDNDTDGVVYIAEQVKLFTKSEYGATSPQYKEISKIPFRRVKKR